MTNRENELRKLAKINRLLIYYNLTNDEQKSLEKLKQKTENYLKNDKL